MYQNDLLVKGASEEAAQVETHVEKQEDLDSDKSNELVVLPLQEKEGGEMVNVEDESPASGENKVADETKSEILTPTEINNLVKGSVCFIETSGEEGKATATGFICYSREALITNFHVLEGADSISIKDLDGNQIVFEGVLGWDQENDLAAIRISGSKAKDSIKIAKTPVQAGDPIVVVGNPSGLIGSVSTGIVAALRELEKSSWIQMTAPISSGSSGSPVLNERGEVVGVVSFMISGKTRQNTNFASSSKVVHRLIRECRISKMLGLRSDWKESVTLADLPRPEKIEEGEVGDEPSDEVESPDVLDAGTIAKMRAAWSYARNDQSQRIESILGKPTSGGLLAFKFMCVAYAGGRYDSAIGQAKACLEIWPQSSVVWTALGECNFKKEEFVTGVQCLIQAIKRDNSYSQPWALLGFELRRHERSKSAGIYASKVACSLVPKLRDEYVERGMWLPELPSEQVVLWRDLYASYFWVEIFPSDVDAWINHILSVKKWEGVKRAADRLKVGLESTDHSPDLLEMQKTL